jgi:hypothetical protein
MRGKFLGDDIGFFPALVPWRMRQALEDRSRALYMYSMPKYSACTSNSQGNGKTVHGGGESRAFINDIN